MSEPIDESGRQTSTSEKPVSAQRPAWGGGRFASVSSFRLALASLVVAVAAVGLVAYREVTGDCGPYDWRTLPAETSLPAGWSLASTEVTATGSTLSFQGPIASDGSGTPQVMYASVGCADGSAHEAIDQARSASERSGGTAFEIGVIGERSFAAYSSADATYSIHFQRGDVLVNVIAAASVDQASFVDVAQAVDAALTGNSSTVAMSSEDAGPVTPGSAPSAPSTSSPSPTATPTVAAPELVAMMPTTVDDVDLTVDSAMGDVVFGTDAAGRAASAALRAADTTSNELEVAAAYDVTGATDLYLLGFRLPELAVADLQAFVLNHWLQAGGAGVTAETMMLGDREVIEVDYGDDGSPTYLYVAEEAVFVIETTDADMAGQVLNVLP